MKLKIGDKVRCIDDSLRCAIYPLKIKKDTIYVIIDQIYTNGNGENMVRVSDPVSIVEDIKIWWLSDRFELITNNFPEDLFTL